MDQQVKVLLAVSIVSLTTPVQFLRKQDVVGDTCNASTPVMRWEV